MKFLRLFSIAGVFYFGLMFCGLTGQETEAVNYYATPVTVQILTPQQQFDRIAYLTALRAPETTTTTQSPITPDYGRCGEWHDTAIRAGWSEHHWPTLSKIMWIESRCQPDACSKSSVTNKRCRDYGLMQGNWSAHNKWWTELGLKPTDLFHPATNLHWSWLLYSGEEKAGRCGWQPWSFKCG